MIQETKECLSGYKMRNDILQSSLIACTTWFSVMVVFCGYDYMKMNKNSSWKFLKLFPESFHKVLLRTDKWQQDVCNRYIFQQQNLGKVQELLADEWVLPKCCCSAAIHHHSETYHWENWRLWTACSNKRTN